MILQRKLVQHHSVQNLPAQQPDFEGSDGSVTGGWAAAAAQAACPQDSFLVCADSANSTPEAHCTAQLAQSASSDASATQEQCWPADSFLVCADSANSASMQGAAADCEDDVTSNPQRWKQQEQQEVEEEDSFVVLADSPLSSLGWCEQQEQLPPQPHLSLPKTVRLLAHKGFISLPLQPAGASVQLPCKQPLSEQPIPAGSAGDSSPASVAESQGSNQPDTTPADTDGMGVAGLRRSFDSSAGDRESAAPALPAGLALEQCSSEDMLDGETASRPESCTSELRCAGGVVCSSFGKQQNCCIASAVTLIQAADTRMVGLARGPCFSSRCTGAGLPAACEGASAMPSRTSRASCGRQVIDALECNYSSMFCLTSCTSVQASRLRHGQAAKASKVLLYDRETASRLGTRQRCPSSRPAHAPSPSQGSSSQLLVQRWQSLGWWRRRRPDGGSLLGHGPQPSCHLRF